MKSHISIIIAIGISIGLSSCAKFLEEDPKDILSTQNFYENELDARQAMNGTYRYLTDEYVTGHGTKQISTDLTKRADWDEGGGLRNYKFGADNDYITQMWQHHYTAIKNCNSVIDNVTEHQDRINNWERYVAEARGVRAYLYFDLVRWFGDVPLVLKETKSLNDLKVARSPQKQVLEQIIADFSYAMAHVAEKGDTNNGYQYGRISKDACRGFLAKVHLWLASVATRDGREIVGSAAENYIKAMNYAKEVIQSGHYQLVEYYPDVFNAKTKVSEAPKEVIWCVQGLTGDDTGTLTGMVYGMRGNENLGGSWDNISSSDYHRMIYEPSDSIRRLWNCPRAQVLDNGKIWGWDYRIYWDTRADQKLSEATENNNWVMWSIGKFRRFPLADTSSYNYKNFGMDEPLLRFADVLLIYAEAYNEVNHSPGAYTPSSNLTLNGTNVQSAYDAVNLVRKRARISNKAGGRVVHRDALPRDLDRSHINAVDNVVPDWKTASYGYDYAGSDLYTAKHYTNDYTAFRTEILNERARELVGETTDRWCDLVRRGILVQALQNWRINNPFISSEERRIPAPAAPENIRPYHQLLPIPLSEIDANKNLTQNPGY